MLSYCFGYKSAVKLPYKEIEVEGKTTYKETIELSQAGNKVSNGFV